MREERGWCCLVEAVLQRLLRQVRALLAEVEKRWPEEDLEHRHGGQRPHQPAPKLPPHPHRRNDRRPFPAILEGVPAIRQQPAQQAHAEAAPARVPAAVVPLAALVERARRRGLVSLPAYLTVGLVAQLCRALQQAHEQGAVAEGELNLATVVVGFDGQVRPTCFGEARPDVAAAALVLDQLLGETLDPELTRIIGDARAKEPSITTAVGLERRLVHWQVKQRQLFPGHDLTAALARWLFPNPTRSLDADVAEWLCAQCTGPLIEEPEPPSVIEPSKPFNWRWIAGVALVLLFGTAVAMVLQLLTVRRHSLETLPPDAVVEPAVAVVVPLPTPKPVLIEAAPVAGPALPRTATGAPAKLKLSSEVHGVLLERSGFPITAPSRRWAVKVAAPRGRKKAPRYASLFVAELGDGNVARLARVGPEAWLPLTGREARVFLMQTDQPADDGSFSLELGIPRGEGVRAAELREDVLTDAMTQLESSRFVLDGLDVGQRYEVTQQRAARGATPPVIATVTIPNVHTRELRGAGFKQAGAPLDQVLLQPGVPVKVAGVSRLSFVVLTTADAPEAFSTIEVVPRGAAPAPKRGAPALPGETCRDFAPPGTDCSTMEQPGPGER